MFPGKVETWVTEETSSKASLTTSPMGSFWCQSLLLLPSYQGKSISTRSQLKSNLNVGSIGSTMTTLDSAIFTLHFIFNKGSFDRSDLRRHQNVFLLALAFSSMLLAVCFSGLIIAKLLIRVPAKTIDNLQANQHPSAKRF